MTIHLLPLTDVSGHGNRPWAISSDPNHTAVRPRLEPTPGAVSVGRAEWHDRPLLKHRSRLDLGDAHLGLAHWGSAPDVELLPVIWVLVSIEIEGGFVASLQYLQNMTQTVEAGHLIHLFVGPMISVRSYHGSFPVHSSTSFDPLSLAL
jgi:hypothetical protein